jgi:hypothetical protein
MPGALSTARYHALACEPLDRSAKVHPGEVRVPLRRRQMRMARERLHRWRRDSRRVAGPVVRPVEPSYERKELALGCRAMRPPPATDRLSQSLELAIGGNREALLSLLARGSRLPGTQANNALADAFAQACRALGARADKVALDLAHLSPDEAPGASPLEFLPVCGVIALGARAGADEKVRRRFVAELHASADDSRFRVRDAVVDALARIGAGAGDSLVEEVAPWMDGYFHAAAVLRALARDEWLGRLHAVSPVIARVDEAFRLALDAPRAAARYPGHKALLEALHRTPAVVVLRFGVPVFDVVLQWCSVKDPVLRDVPAALLDHPKVAARFGPDLARVRQALDASRPAPRNPDHDVGPTRDRSGARRSKRRL